MKRPEVSVIVATYNEADNIPLLIPRIHEALKKAGINEEIIVVDDSSPDGTAKVAMQMAKKYPVRVVERPKKQGLIPACEEGFRNTKAGIIGCIDADFSHPPEKLPELIKPIIDGKADMTVGSRHAPGGGIKEDWPLKRRIISWGAMTLARPLSSVKDSGAGFFFFRREIINGVKFRRKGFKMALEVLVKGHYRRAMEIPIMFGDRVRGESKMGNKQIMDYVVHLAQLYKYKFFKR